MSQQCSGVAALHPRHWPRLLAHALLPCSCALCGQAGGAVVCGPCAADYLAAGAARCRRCANPLPEGAGARLACAACQRSAAAFDATIVAADYAAPLDQLVLRLKFGGVLALAPWFAGALAQALAAQPGFDRPELLCPVPLGPRRLAERGFNQALEIARPLAARLGLALAPRLLVRPRDTLAQSSVAPSQRRSNIRHAFVLAPQQLERVRGRHIGVVDDVMTSGSTLDEVAATLKRFGAARVSNLVFARTPPH